LITEFIFELFVHKSDNFWPQETSGPHPNPAVAELNIVAAAFANCNYLAGLRPFPFPQHADRQFIERFRLHVEPFSNFFFEVRLLLFSLRFLQRLGTSWVRDGKVDQMLRPKCAGGQKSLFRPEWRGGG
jgi:hypothetical protein